MATRRNLIKSIATVVAGSAIAEKTSMSIPTPELTNLTVRPYQWKGPYADYRTKQKALHDWRLCAEVRGPWPGPCERIILRTSEVIGHETGFLYDDHFPPSEPDGRGKNYHHIPFEWTVTRPDRELYADCHQPGEGRFTMRLTAETDFVDIRLSVRNDTHEPMLNVDWAFCTVAFESPSILDPDDVRTYLYDGNTLRTLASIRGRDMMLYKVEGAHGFIPVGHRHLPIGPVEAQAPVVIVEGVGGNNCAALTFQHSDSIYGDAKGNKCFHADPYFGPRLEPGEEKSLLGRFYLMEGNAQAAFERFRRDSAA